MTFFKKVRGSIVIFALFAVTCIQVRAEGETGSPSDEATREPAAERNREPAARGNNREDEEYNFSWLDPDKKVYVLQNRRYRKKFRPGAFATGGLNLSNPFRSEYLLAPKVSFWFTEQFGVEGFFTKVWGSSNSTFDAVKTVTTGLPFVREMNSYYGGLFLWAPYYAKLNFFNKIFYLDWFLNAGLGQLNTTQNQNRSATGGQGPVLTESFLGVFYGTGFNFFITNGLLFRLDITGIAYRAKGADNVTERTKTNYDITAGVGYLFF